MVTSTEDRSVEARFQLPSYSLDRVKELAKADRIQYIGKGVPKDIDGLGFTTMHVKECLCELTAGDFRESIKYSNRKKRLDVYVTRFLGPSGLSVPLYIKLSLSDGCLSVSLFSFHRENP